LNVTDGQTSFSYFGFGFSCLYTVKYAIKCGVRAKKKLKDKRPGFTDPIGGNTFHNDNLLSLFIPKRYLAVMMMMMGFQEVLLSRNCNIMQMENKIGRFIQNQHGD
jgi:hypothetical protein